MLDQSIRWIYFLLCFQVFSVQLKKKQVQLQNLDWNVWCKFQPNANECVGDGVSTGRYYYDLKLENCKTFNYGHCPNSYNNFNTLSDCYESCIDDGLHLIKENLTANVYCRLQPDFGRCFDYHPMFYFDVNQRKCVGFSYSGCGGNLNRFPSIQDKVDTKSNAKKSVVKRYLRSPPQIRRINVDIQPRAAFMIMHSLYELCLLLLLKESKEGPI